MYSRCVKRVFYSAFVRKCTYMCKHRFGVQLLQHPPLCSSTAATTSKAAKPRVEAGRHLCELEGRRVGGQGGHLGILYRNWAVEGIQHQRCTATKKIYHLCIPEKKLHGLSHVPDLTNTHLFKFSSIKCF
jgi:hypothetical protein